MEIGRRDSCIRLALIRKIFSEKCRRKWLIISSSISRFAESSHGGVVGFLGEGLNALKMLNELNKYRKRKEREQRGKGEKVSRCGFRLRSENFSATRSGWESGR